MALGDAPEGVVPPGVAVALGDAPEGVVPPGVTPAVGVEDPDGLTVPCGVAWAFGLAVPAVAPGLFGPLVMLGKAVTRTTLPIRKEPEFTARRGN